MFTNETDRMLTDGGVMQEGGSVDPVSGNDVPPGAMQEEVRDDIDAKLSEGEFVIPADVVRYIGLSTLMKMRDKAKEGLKKMEEIGQMGNAQEVPNAEALHGGDSEMDDESFSSEVDSILGEEEGMPAFAEGGYVDPSNAPLYKSSPIKGFEMVSMVNESGNIIYIPHLNSKPLLAIPSGYFPKTSALPPVTGTPATTGVTAGPTDSSSSDGGGRGDMPGGGGGGGGRGGGGTPSISDEGEVSAATTGLTDKQAGVIGFGVGVLSGVPFGGLAGKVAGEKLNARTNTTYAEEAKDVARGIKSGDEMGYKPGDPFATAGEKGTGGQAANAASTAAAAAVAAGYSDEAVAAAAQAAAEATVAGASSTAAAEAGRAAAATVANDIDAVDASKGYEAPAAPAAPDTTAPDAPAGQGGGEGIDGGDISGASADTPALAKGGFVSKKAKPNVIAKSKKGLASRK